ncbi:uncharacterized protein MONBRDRAFT_12595 [Monosiga brevicollis MX1]|uniref:ABC1 atypical kinase-like domain-containing protein n=1 Tax=Monosiga brevicollis TaxID=81824 RepID=A9VCR3_MONBE|nr:uncharacterized protein MONBRDRAFT_12595 [Monosiga brevicollis MX1]EDQ84730.1 predicted protein [Monosiga brevicollis MX1]|eukprot:XP_001750516.1 hypothetical protein [Monosiga brevicollis MX1]
MAASLTRWLRRNPIKSTLAVTALAAHQYDTHFCYERFNRNVRTLFAAIATVYDYKIDLDRHPEAIDDIHARVAQRWYNICCVNAGLYIKLGQSVSLMNHIMPPAFGQLFAALQDQAPYVDYDEVCKVFREDFNGLAPHEIFAEFDRQPVASASIAQVHHAKLHDGTEVAVKVQKPNIRYQMPFDLWCYRIMVKAFEWTFDLPLYWTTHDLCKSITLEADFRSEANFTKQAKQDLEGHVPHVYVPRVYDEFSRPRVMVQEWIVGDKLSKTAELQAKGFSIKDVMTTTMRAFAHQLFISGRVHGDPHPGNIIVRQEPGNPKTQHQSLILTDFKALKEVCTDWGIHDSELFASLQLFRPFGKKSARRLRPEELTKEQLMQFQVEAKNRVRELLKETHKIPSELVILGRTMNCLRGNNKAAGSVVNRVNIFAQTAVQGLELSRSERANQRGLLQADRSWWEWLRAKSMLLDFRYEGPIRPPSTAIGRFSLCPWHLFEVVTIL